MNVSENTKEWFSIGTGAMVSGALAVILAQSAIVRQPSATPIYGQVVGLAEEPGGAASADERRGSVESTAPRLLLPTSGRVASTDQAQDSGESEAADAKPVVRLDRLETEVGKGTLGMNPEHLTGAKERLVAELDSDKSVPATVAAHLSGAQLSPKDIHRLQQTSELEGIRRFTPQTTPVNAGFEGTGLRSSGEEFSWDVHNAFQSASGPMPFFYVDSDSGTLMFGLGWQH